MLKILEYNIQILFITCFIVVCASNVCFAQVDANEGRPYSVIPPTPFENNKQEPSLVNKMPIQDLLVVKHPCSQPQAVLKALEEWQDLLGIKLHRYLNENGAYRILPFSYSFDNPGKTSFFIVASNNSAIGRHWFVEEIGLTQIDQVCHVISKRRWEVSPIESMAAHQASHALHISWKAYMERIRSLLNNGTNIWPEDVLAWPDPAMITTDYINENYLPVIKFGEVRPGDIAFTENGKLAFTIAEIGYFSKEENFYAMVRNNSGWERLRYSKAKDLIWYRPVEEYWKEKATHFLTIGGHDRDRDLIYSGMDNCPCCSEGGRENSINNGCPACTFDFGNANTWIPSFQVGTILTVGSQLKSTMFLLGFGFSNKRLSLDIAGLIGTDFAPRFNYGVTTRIRISALAFANRSVEPFIGFQFVSAVQRSGKGSSDWNMNIDGLLGLDWTFYKSHDLSISLEGGGYVGVNRRKYKFTDDYGEIQKPIVPYVDGGAFLGIRILIY